MTDYTPNFSDARVLKRIRTAYAFARACLSETKPKQWAKSHLDKVFGSQNHDLSKWLRVQLLLVHDNYYAWGEDATEGPVCKSYLLNVKGAACVKSILLGEEKTTMPPLNSYHSVALLSQEEIIPQDTFDYKVVREWVKRDFGDQINSGNFEYDDKSNRLWNPIQNVRSKYRAPILAEAGYHFNYDLECAAPTLILQHAQSLGMDEYLFALTDFIKDRTKYRQHVADVAGISLKQAKMLINALFCGARLGANRDFALFRALNQDYRAIRALQADPWLTQLRADIKTCWDAIEPSMTRIEVKSAKTGKMRKLPLRSGAKWARYFQLERSVMDVARKHLRETHNMNFLEHDGFRCKKQVEVVLLEQLIKQQTGFTVKFEEEKLASS